VEKGSGKCHSSPAKRKEQGSNGARPYVLNTKIKHTFTSAVNPGHRDLPNVRKKITIKQGTQIILHQQRREGLGENAANLLVNGEDKAGDEG